MVFACGKEGPFEKEPVHGIRTIPQPFFPGDILQMENGLAAEKICFARLALSYPRCAGESVGPME